MLYLISTIDTESSDLRIIDIIAVYHQYELAKKHLKKLGEQFDGQQKNHHGNQLKFAHRLMAISPISLNDPISDDKEVFFYDRIEAMLYNLADKKID